MIRVVSVATDPSELLRHTHMGFVDPHTLMLNLHWLWVLPLVPLRRIPEDAVEKIGVCILFLVGRPSRIPIHPVSIRALNIDLVLGVVGNARSTIWISRYFDTPSSELISLTPKLLSVPMVEITENGEAFCSWSPFVVLNVSVGLDLKAILLVASCDIEETSFSVLEDLHPPIN